VVTEDIFLMRKLLLVLFLLSPGWAQDGKSLKPAMPIVGNACDLNHDGTVNILDIQLAVNMALGVTPCTANVTSPGVCDVVMVQRVTNAVLTGSCVGGITAPHSVTLSWTASTSSNIVGYNVYRASQARGPYTKLSPGPVAGTNYVDLTVATGQTYFYVTTAVDNGNNESAYSNQAQAVVPSP
jgi:hypothetical protein